MRGAVAAAAVAGMLLVLAGCGVLSREIQREAVRLNGFAELRENWSQFQNAVVIVGGEIIEVRNRAEETVLLVLERPLAWGQRPKSDAPSGGRFMVRFAEYLDPFLFAAGRSVTVAGRVAGEEAEPVGEAPYRYVLLDGMEIHLWREPSYPSYHPWYPPDPWYPCWYEPRFGRRPWWW